MMGVYLHFSSHNAWGSHGIIFFCHAGGLLVYCLVFVMVALNCVREQVLYQPHFNIYVNCWNKVQNKVDVKGMLEIIHKVHSASKLLIWAQSM